MFPNTPNMSDYHEIYESDDLHLELTTANFGESKYAIIIHRRRLKKP
jgi:hypothetical protein